MAQTAPRVLEPDPGRTAADGDRHRSDKLDREIIVISSVVVIGAIMSILDTTIVNVALATLGHQLHASLSTIHGRSLATRVAPDSAPGDRRTGDRQAVFSQLMPLSPEGCD
jgi:hypothetical protein